MTKNLLITALLLTGTCAGAQSFVMPNLAELSEQAARMEGVGPGVLLSAARSSAADRIASATWAAPDNLKKTTEGGKTVWRLYGRVINGESTAEGRLACALVASTILNKAGAGVSVTEGVGSLESQLRNSKRWRQIESVGALEPGDVIVWRKRFADDACTGGGDCHVGIYWGSGLAYDNDGKFGYPMRYPVVPRVAFAFKVAYRAR